MYPAVHIILVQHETSYEKLTIRNFSVKSVFRVWIDAQFTVELNCTRARL